MPFDLSSIADGASEGVFGAHTGAANALAALKGVEIGRAHV